MAHFWLHPWSSFKSLLVRLCAKVLVALGVKIISVTHPERIGHLAVEPDCFLKEGLLHRRPRYCALFLIDPETPVANRRLLEYWRTRLTFVEHPVLLRMLAPFRVMPQLRYEVHPYAVTINETARYGAIQSDWRGRGPLLNLSRKDLERGLGCLKVIGLPPGAWFVGVHCREAGYVAGEIHDHRNADIANYIAAMEGITERGGWCVRLGDPTMRPLPPMKNVVDYAHSPYRSDWMDVFLCASARFILGSSSGLYCVGSVFGRPSALANLVPLSMLSYGSDDINIPKLIFSEEKRRHLRFNEIFASEIANFRFTRQYESAGLRLEESTAEDIRALSEEMIDRCERHIAYTPRDEALQGRYKAFFRPGHYSYGASPRIGREFLRKYEHLLGDESVAT